MDASTNRVDATRLGGINGDGHVHVLEDRTPRHAHAVLLGEALRLLVARVDMPHHAHARVDGEHPLEPSVGTLSALCHDHHARVQRIADADAAAVVDRDPGGPAAVLISALRIGQSAIASEPSFMPSVSRLGEATLPQSRWSRLMTMGPDNSPLRTISLKRRPARWRSP